MTGTSVDAPPTAAGRPRETRLAAGPWVGKGLTGREAEVLVEIAAGHVMSRSPGA